MSITRRLIAATAAFPLSAATVIGLAQPASAAQTFTVNCSGTGTTEIALSASPGEVLTFNFSGGCTDINTPVDAAASTVITYGSSTSSTPSFVNGNINLWTVSSFPSATSIAVTLASSLPSSIRVTFMRTAGGPPVFTQRYAYNSGGGGSAASTPAPTETLTLAVEASGATCTGGNPSGTSGSWLTLPSADQCTQSGPTAKADARLLGWATSADFPIARAQAQIDKQWGVIDEEINGVRMIFIPAGMATFVSGSNNLYPIWSK